MPQSRNNIECLIVYGHGQKKATWCQEKDSLAFQLNQSLRLLVKQSMLYSLGFGMAELPIISWTSSSSKFMDPHTELQGC